MLFPISSTPSETVQNWIEQYFIFRKQLIKWRYCARAVGCWRFPTEGRDDPRPVGQVTQRRVFVPVHPLSTVVIIPYLSISFTKMKIGEACEPSRQALLYPISESFGKKCSCTLFCSSNGTDKGLLLPSALETSSIRVYCRLALNKRRR